MEEKSLIAIRQELRQASLNRRNGIPQNMRDAYSELIRKKTIEYLEKKSPRSVHIYISVRSEVRTDGIIEDLFERRIQVIVPITRNDNGNEHIVHSLFEKGNELRAGNFGVPEPVAHKIISEDEIEVVILPVVAYDGFGVRLGYGKGYYDRFLSTLPLKVDRIGLAFSVQEVDKIPIMSHDQLMFSLFTEQSHFFFK